MAVHFIVPMNVNVSPERETWAGTFEGGFDEVVAESVAHLVGDTADGNNGTVANWLHPSIDPDGVQMPPVNTSSVVTRKEGGLAELLFSYSYIRKTEAWSCDMAEIGKDIRTWLVTPKGGMSQSEAASALAKIAQWEAYRDSGDLTRWQNFQCNDQGGTLEGNALVLAQKIMKGVSNYSIYAPVITKTTQWNAPPPLENYGKIETPYVRDGWEILGVGADISEWTSKSNAWLKTACRSSPNGDGTWTLIEQWTGADEIDGDLYDTATIPTPPPEEGEVE